MKDTAVRACGVCQSMLRLPADVCDVVPPDSDSQANVTATAAAAAEASKRPKRKRYIRPPGEKPNLSTKMQYLYDELFASSRKNPNSPNYDPFSMANSDEVEELDQDGKPFVVKTVVLYVPFPPLLIHVALPLTCVAHNGRPCSIESGIC